ncbi:Ribosomal lysine N-methyltransferase set10 [Cyphellophora attinorum]|uniref:Ribosomal lysine N-methyltransferase set10 n=1 Tax=Cyphellophora attinorum TaxID=1664694 RepID=A0A0N1HRK0_9EURO|nr:Ribosomal lysine N-methyltransferase set10 [Phialophora attinorum]KPI40927.1 Ribosomal lysine N-methyltransferase set10 [Phialophora attinorum]
MADQIPVNGGFDGHRKLAEWVVTNGGYMHPDIDFAYSKDSGYHIVAGNGKTVTPGTRVSSCPMACTMSVMNVFNTTPFPNRGTRFPEKFIRANLESPELLQTFFLMEQHVLGDQSWWAPYIKTLPTVNDVNQLQFDSPADAAFIRGTNLEVGYRELMARWRGYYDKGLIDLKANDWRQDKCFSYTWELFRWAASMFGSRGFSSAVLADTAPAEDARLRITKDSAIRKLWADRFSVLLPLMDMHNHKPKTKVDWQPRTSFVGLQVHDTYQAGEQIYNNYGPKDNESLLLSYGFISENRSFQHVALSIQVPPGTLLDVTRKFQVDMRSNAEHKLYILNIGHVKAASATCLEAVLFDYDLLDTISVLTANERESSAMLAEEATLMSTCLAREHKFQDFRNLLGVLGQIIMHCETGRKRLISTRPKEAPTSSKQLNANRLRDQQIGHYEDALLLGKVILAQACQSHLEAASATKLVHAFGKEYAARATTNIMDLFNRLPKITRHEELFTLPKLVAMLPPAAQTTLSGLLKDIEASAIRHLALSSTFDAPTTDQLRATQQIRMALCISAAHHTYTRGLKVDKRLASWLEQVTAWYPTDDDETWAYVPSADGPWSIGEQPPVALLALMKAAEEHLLDGQQQGGIPKQWLKPKALCWAYNVMFEEVVAVPKRVVQVSSHIREDFNGDQQVGAGGEEGIDVLLYIKSE